MDDKMPEAQKASPHYESQQAQQAQQTQQTRKPQQHESKQSPLPAPLDMQTRVVLSQVWKLKQKRQAGTNPRCRRGRCSEPLRAPLPAQHLTSSGPHVAKYFSLTTLPLPSPTSSVRQVGAPTLRKAVTKLFRKDSTSDTDCARIWAAAGKTGTRRAPGQGGG